MTKTHLPTTEEHKEIAALAHQIYESSGYPQGCAQDHWKEAQEILQKRKEHMSDQDRKEQKYFKNEVFAD